MSNGEAISILKNYDFSKKSRSLQFFLFFLICKRWIIKTINIKKKNKERLLKQAKEQTRKKYRELSDEQKDKEDNMEDMDDIKICENIVEQENWYEKFYIFFFA